MPTRSRTTPTPGQAHIPTYLPRNKYVAAALALFFGIFGLHNFYLGYTGKGVAQVLISVLTFGIGAIAVMIRAIVEAIQILTADYGTEHHRDARGVGFRISGSSTHCILRGWFHWNCAPHCDICEYQGG